MSRLHWILACTVFCAAAAHAGETATPAKAPSLAELIFSKLEYDQHYFQKILEHQRSGTRPGRLSPETFAHEVKRAQGNLPVLATLFKERPGYAQGKPLTVPTGEEHRVYGNLLALLNMLQATDRGDFAAVVKHGSRVVLDKKESFGQVRGTGTQYYLNLYRQYFFLMAQAHYGLNQDAEAVRWMARIEANADLQALKREIADARMAQGDAEALRRETLRLKPVAVMTFKNLVDDEKSAWLGPGVAEVLTADLIQHSDLVVIERTQLNKALDEIGLSRMGFTDEANARKVGQFLSAGTLLVGSCHDKGETILISMRLIDVERGTALGAASGEAKSDELFPGTRKLVLQLLRELGWADEMTADEMTAARTPRQSTVRSLMQARMLKATKSDEAKALYAQAIREDPAYANLFEDLKSEFSDVSSTVAVMPFLNVTGADEDLWMVHGVRETLSADLPKLRFTVVERAQLDQILERQAKQQMLGADEARQMGQKVGADFIVLGSLMHQAPRIRIDARFVEVRTGVITTSVSVENTKDDMMALLVTLSKALAAKLNEKLDEETIEELAGRKRTPEDFKKFVRQQLAKESMPKGELEDQVEPEVEDETPSRAPFWVAVSGAVAGTALAATGFVLADRAGDEAGYYDGLQQVSSEARRPEFLKKRDDKLDEAKNLSIAGYIGVGLAGAAVTYIVIEEILRATADEEETPKVTPTAGGTAAGAFVGLTGRF